MALVASFSAIQLYRSPHGAGELEIVPDSVEYAVAARHLATTGRYAIDINGTEFPPRYSPGFSALFLAPVYAIAPREIGNGVLSVIGSAVLAAVFAFVIGRRLAGDWGGVLAAVALMHHKEFTIHARLIMSDVPTVMLFLLGCWLFLKMYAERESAPGNVQFLAAGMAIAIAASLRPLSVDLGLPFAMMFIRDTFSKASDRKGNIILDGIFLAGPILALVVITALYNQHIFGDWRRTGYQYWCPVPYDYPELVFSRSYLKQNLSLLTWKLVWMTIAFGIFGGIVLWRMRLPAIRAMIFFSFFATIPLSAAYLFYFFKELRFYYPSQALLCIFGGAGLGALVCMTLRRFPRASTALAAVATLAILVPKLPAQPILQFQPRRAVAEAIANRTPANAVILTNMDPVYLSEILVAGAQRKLWPITREMPYASRVIVGHRIPDPTPYPRNWEDQRMDRLLNAGGKPIFQFTAAEAPGRISEWISAGIPVYLESYPWKDEQSDATTAKAAMAKAFDGQPDGQFPWLVRLRKALP